MTPAIYYSFMSLFGERARRGKKAVDNNRALGARAYPSGPAIRQVFTVTATGPARELQQSRQQLVCRYCNNLDIFQQHQIMAPIARLDAEVLNNELGDRYDSR